MGDLVKTVFGGTDDSAQKDQKRQNAAVSKYQKEQTVEAKDTARKLSFSGEANRNMGNQAMLDIMNQYIPQQMDTFQQGNVAAQQQLLSGLPQMQNALMGAPTTFRGMQPSVIDYDTNFIPQSMPDFGTQEQALSKANDLPQLEGIDVSQLPPEVQALLANINPRGGSEDFRSGRFNNRDYTG
jgi:hypothetical protein